MQHNIRTHLPKSKVFDICVEKAEDIETCLKLLHMWTFNQKSEGLIPWKYYKRRIENNLKTLEYFKNNL